MVAKAHFWIPSALLFSTFYTSAFFRNRICGRMLDHVASKQNMSDSCTVFSSILSFAGPSNGWQPMVTPADWEGQMETKPVLFSEKCFLYNKRPCIANTMFTGRDDCGCRNCTFVFSKSGHLHVWEIHSAKNKTCLVFRCAAACWIMLCQNITCLTAALSSVSSYHPPWQPMVNPADWEVQMETKLTSSFPESPFRNKCVWLNISTWPTTYDIELWEWPKKTWRGNCIAKKIKSESRLSSVPASFAESCPKFQSATPSHWNLWHAIGNQTCAGRWLLRQPITCIKMGVLGKKHDTPGTTKFLVVPGILYGFKLW